MSGDRPHPRYRLSAEWWRRRAQLARLSGVSLRHRRQLQRELRALSVDPAFAVEFMEELRRSLVRQREEALLVAIFEEAANSKGELS